MKSIHRATADFPVNEIYLNRELSQVAFNQRVLALAEDENVPLLERLRFLCITCNNLDEFFEVRIASMMAHGKEGGPDFDHHHLDASLERISQACHGLVESQYAILNEKILPGLARKGVALLPGNDRNDEQRLWVRRYFEEQIRPILTPIVLDPAHPFPQVANKTLNFIVSLSGKDAFGRGSAIAIVKAPRALPRVIRMPQEIAGDKMAFCLLSSVIQAHIADLFPQREVVAYSPFRVTRDSDLWVDEDEVKNLREALKTELRSRQFGEAVRLEVGRSCPEDLAQFLLDQFSLGQRELYRVNGPVNLVRLSEMIEQANLPALMYPPFIPPSVVTLQGGDDIFAVMRRRDILLHHPYQSFQTVIDFIRASAHDPDVVVIKQTVYRAGMNSELMESLIHAARHGKEVIAIVELKARFDEEQNIDWAQRLEQSGAQVIYGVMGLKTHAKLSLVIRRENGRLRHYAHMGTGNYNPTTARTYTDFGLMTANQDIASEVNEVFIHLSSLTRPKKLSHLWLAPFSLQSEIVRAILNEAGIAEQGRPARIIAKMNALIDESVIRALYAASRAGVKIDLIVRGACTLRPGVAGLSDNIRVCSIIGRFLEHTRIYYFRNDLKNDLYLSSADWMARNLFRRIEVAFPVLDKKLKKRILEEGLKPYLRDNESAWKLQPDGQYKLKSPRKKQAAHNAQQELLRELATGTASRKGV